MQTLHIGMIGLDTSHVTAFTKLLHQDPSDSGATSKARVVAAFPGGSPDFNLSLNRVAGFTAELRDTHGVEIVDSIAALRGKCNAILLESVDGRVHLEQFREVADWGLPVFIDKPLAVSSRDANEIIRLAADKGVPLASSSALRFAGAFREAITGEPILGADFFGPMAFVDKCPGYFWYGIHSADMLFTALGGGCREVLAKREESHDVIIGRWGDGRLGTLRGNRVGNSLFGGTLHGEKSSVAFDVSKSAKPYYASLLDQIIPFFRGEKSLLPPPSETAGVIRFLEAANQSADSGTWVAL